MNVLVAGGGTAGHIFPALALARVLESDHGATVGFAGTPQGQEARLVPAAGFPFHPVDARPLRREVSLAALTAPFASIRSIGACRPLVERADVVVGMGGYVSVPVGLAAVRSRRPLVLHEQNAVPGLANRVLARRATSVALAFAEAAARLPSATRTVLTGNPVREPILAVPTRREALAAEARAELDLASDRRTLVVFGGSQGALHVNTVVVQTLRHLVDRADLQVLLLSGPAHEAHVREALADTGALRVVVRGFLERMELAYALADLVLARAGATTCAEISVCGVAAILVPYPHATGHHQEANARALERAGGALVMLDESLHADALASVITELLDDAARRQRMGAAMRAWARPSAANELARVVAEAAGGR